MGMYVGGVFNLWMDILNMILMSGSREGMKFLHDGVALLRLLDGLD